MTLSTMPDALATLRPDAAIGAFNVITLELAEAIVRGAEQAGLPVVMQVSENTVAWHGDPAPILRASIALAQASEADVVVHLDHATQTSLVHTAVGLGVTSVMYDGSRLDDAANRDTTKQIVHHCHARGVWVEAELGAVGGKDGAHAPGVRTDPDAAADFVSQTGVDALAVAVGTSHAMTTRDAIVDLDLISTLADAVPVPLVLHGSSGVREPHLVEAVAAGMRKVNIATHLNGILTASARAELTANPDVTDPRTWLGPARDLVADEIAHLLGLLAGTTEPRTT